MSCFECFCGIFGAEDPKQKALKVAKAKCVELILSKSCGPILIRTAWHDSGTYDMANKSKGFPNSGGAIGSIRTPHEIDAPPNAGLKKALDVYLTPIKNELEKDGLVISWADLIQLASATAVEVMGGPKIPMKYGRVDGTPTELAPAPFGLPAAFPDSPAQHLRDVFYKYDSMSDEDIVALSGAHTVGRAFADRSGTVAEGSAAGQGTAYTKRGAAEGQKSLSSGGRSWTKNWLVFDNSYFTDMGKNDPEVIYFPTDTVLQTDAGFKVHCERFAKDQAAFFASYANAHKKLSELGCKWEPAQGITGV